MKYEKGFMQRLKKTCINQFSPKIIEELRKTPIFLHHELFTAKAELLQLDRTQYSSLGIFVSKKVGNRKN